MTGLESGVPIAVRVGVAIVQRVAPTGLSLVRSWLKGKEVLVLGQPRVGKTTFVDYLQHGFFEDEKETDKTLDLALTPRFNVKIGRDSALELTVKTSVDIPGQWGAVKHADVAFERNPHAVLVLLNLASSLDGESEDNPAIWLREFSSRLETHWRTEESRSSRLRVMMILMNKADKVSADVIDHHKRSFRAITNSELRDARGKMKESVAIVPTCLVTNLHGTKYIDSAIAQLAKRLTK